MLCIVIIDWTNLNLKIKTKFADPHSPTPAWISRTGHLKYCNCIVLLVYVMNCNVCQYDCK